MQYFDKNRPMQTFLLSVRDILTSPKAFFAELPPAAFYATSIFILTGIVFIASFAGIPFRGFSLLFMVPVSWGLSLIALKFWSAYLSWAVKAMAHGKLTTANAFHISSYAFVPLVLAYIPVVGLIACVWSIYLLWVALVSRCHVKPGLAAIIIVIPALIFASAATEVLVLFAQMFPQLNQ